MWLFLACTAPSSVATAPWSPDDEVAPAWAPETACELVYPRPVTLADLAAPLPFYGPYHVELAALTSDLPAFEDAFGCPSSTTDGSGAVTWEGSCAREGWSWTGWWTTSEDPVTGSRRVTADARWTDELNVGLDVDFAGESSVTISPDESRLERDFSLSLRGYGTDRDGQWIVVSEEVLRPGRFEGRTWVSASLDSGVRGESCVVDERERVAGCDLEPAGGLAILGAPTAILAWDPEVSCDGCARTFLDGVEGDLYCPEASFLP